MAAVVAGGLAGCTQGKETPGGRLFDLVRSRLFEGEEPGIGRATDLTRAQLNQIPQATIGFSYGEFPPVYMVPLADNGGYLIYQDRGRRGVVMYGGGVAGTLGLGDDLQTVKHALDDPVAHRTPLSAWPSAVVRSYRFRVRDLDEYIITVACEFDQQERVVYEIAEIQFTVTRVVERCGNAARQFENIYWVEDSGFIWASEQWLGPNLESATIEIVRPYGG